MRKILLVALTAAAMVSCSENEGFENESTMNRIKFGTVVKTGTKTLVATTENFSKFTVSAYKTTDDMGGTVQLNYNPQIQISAESETKRSIFREKDKTKRSKKESAQHSKSRNKSFVMTSVSAL